MSKIKYKYWTKRYIKEELHQNVFSFHGPQEIRQKKSSRCSTEWLIHICTGYGGLRPRGAAIGGVEVAVAPTSLCQRGPKGPFPHKT